MNVALDLDAYFDPPIEGTELPREAKRVVVCDADDVSSRILGRTLAREGFPVSTCGTAAECEALVAREQPTLVVLALLLPDMDGLALTRRLRALPRPPRILMASALQAERRAVEAGADAFLRKPISAQTLVETVRTLIEQPER